MHVTGSSGGRNWIHSNHASGPVCVGIRIDEGRIVAWFADFTFGRRVRKAHLRRHSEALEGAPMEAYRVYFYSAHEERLFSNFLGTDYEYVFGNDVQILRAGCVFLSVEVPSEECLYDQYNVPNTVLHIQIGTCHQRANIYL